MPGGLHRAERVTVLWDGIACQIMRKTHVKRLWDSGSVTPPQVVIREARALAAGHWAINKHLAKKGLREIHKHSSHPSNCFWHKVAA